ncbi:GNAT family N-acetyltransferase [Kitasatospora sp. NPDC051853]|uniref:GNAT family N-acetyltransferase n=1 Tax=Kitasatospora sp. NPDC051853 TaxID=3364058 RepID=UPI0037903A9C
MESKIVDRPDLSRYEVIVDGDRLAGFAEYRLGEGEIAFTHTEVNPAFEGHGLASSLARFALDDARERGLAVLPYCPYIKGWIAKHPEYVDLVPVDSRDYFEL